MVPGRAVHPGPQAGWRALPHDGLRGDLRQAEGHQRQPSAAILDSQSVKTTEKATVFRVKARGPV